MLPLIKLEIWHDVWNSEKFLFATVGLAISQCLKENSDNEWDIFILYNERCQKLKGLHTPMNEYFSNDPHTVVHVKYQSAKQASAF